MIIKILILIITTSLITFYLLALTLALTHFHSDSIVVMPLFTYSAYQDGGWYDNSSNTVVKLIPYHEGTSRMKYTGNELISDLLSMQSKHITDLELDSNPSILKNYSRVILLHNEYVTRNEYNAIMNHSNIFYMHPNALYKFVELHGDKITLLNKTGNAMSESKTQFTSEYDRCFFHYEIVSYPNGKGLSCYFDSEILLHPEIWNKILQ